MQIDEPPIASMCSGCARPLSWLYSARTLRWVSFTPEPTDVNVLRAHLCRDGIPQTSWRDEHEVSSPDHPARVAAREIAAAASRSGSS